MPDYRSNTIFVYAIGTCLSIEALHNQFKGDYVTEVTLDKINPHEHHIKISTNSRHTEFSYSSDEIAWYTVTYSYGSIIECYNNVNLNRTPSEFTQYFKADGLGHSGDNWKWVSYMKEAKLVEKIDDIYALLIQHYHRISELGLAKALCQVDYQDFIKIRHNDHFFTMDVDKMQDHIRRNKGSIEGEILDLYTKIKDLISD